MSKAPGISAEEARKLGHQLHAALDLKNKSTDEAMRLIKAGASLDVQDPAYKPVIIDATWWRDAPLIEALIEAGAPLDAPGDNGLTALMMALWLGAPDVAQALIEAGADVHAKDDSGYTALLWAVDKGHEKAALALLDRGASPQAQTDKGLTVAIGAARSGCTALLKRLDPAALDLGATYEGMTALMWACMMERAETVTVLLDLGAPLDDRDDSGKTALIWAADSGQAESVAALIAAGADIEAKDDEGKTALDRARNPGVQAGDGNRASVEILEAETERRRLEAEARDLDERRVFADKSTRVQQDTVLKNIPRLRRK